MPTIAQKAKSQMALLGKGGRLLAHRYSRLSSVVAYQAPPEHAGQIAQGVPADDERAEFEGDRAQVGERHAALGMQARRRSGQAGRLPPK